MLKLETILKDTLWVGKYYKGGRIKGTYAELEPMNDEFRDLDIAAWEAQPKHLQEFYEGYFNQRDYYLVSEYYEHIHKEKVKELVDHIVDYCDRILRAADVEEVRFLVGCRLECSEELASLLSCYYFSLDDLITSTYKLSKSKDKVYQVLKVMDIDIA